MVDSHLPRFSQGLMAAILALAFVLNLTLVVPVMGVILLAAVAGGPRYNLFAYLYRRVPVPRGEPEPAAPPRFAQVLGTVFLTIGTIGLFATTDHTAPWWIVGWGAALVVAVLAGLAATTSFCLGCEIYLYAQRLRSRGAAA